MARVGLTTERLTRAGAELADEVGFDKVTLTALARRFDVKVASLYSHLKNSQDLKAKIALLALEELADQGAAALAGRAGKDALTAFATNSVTAARPLTALDALTLKRDDTLLSMLHALYDTVPWQPL